MGEFPIHANYYKQFLMTPKNKAFILALLFAISNFISFGQQKDGSQTKHLTIVQIDSICNSIDNDKKLIEGITEGNILKDEKNIGGYSTYNLKDKMVNGTLYRIRNESSTDLYYKYTFYYFDKLLIKASLIVEDWNTGKQVKTVSSAKYYFDNHKTIKTIGDNAKYSNSPEILRKGLNYQIDFYKDNDDLNKLMNTKE
jgi:hypothetical protein